MDENINNQQDQDNEEKEIDILELVYKLWAKKKLILVWAMWGVLAGLIIAFSIPREYNTSVKLAPEFKRRATLSSGLSMLASMAGIQATSNTGSDAFYPQLYPEIVGSVPFLMSLLDVPVTDKENQHFTVREYLIEETKGPWWGVITGAPRKLIGMVMGGSKSKDNTMDSTATVVNPYFKLSKEEDALVRALKGRITANVDQNTYVIQIDTRMQDPLVSAILADTVVARLRSFVTEYRTDKARQDLDYALKINEEAQQEYYQAQQRLADYIDRNQNLATQSARITRERLQNESSLAFNLYNETSLQVQNAKSKVQETTPVYTELSPATVPMRPSSPRRGLIIGGFTFLAVAACCAWILFGNPLIGQFKTKVSELKQADQGEDDKNKSSDKKADV